MLHHGAHRLNELGIRGEPSAARTKFVTGKIQTVNIESVAREKSAQEIQIVFGARVAVSGYDGYASRAPRFVPEDREFRARAGYSQQLNVQSSSPATPPRR